MLNHEGEGESADNGDNDEDVFENLGNDVVEHDAKFSVWYPMKFEQPSIEFLLGFTNRSIMLIEQEGKI